MRTFEDGRALCEVLEEDRLQALQEAVLAIGHARRGNFDTAREMCAAAETRTRSANLTYLTCQVHLARAEIARAGNRLDEVLECVAKWDSILEGTEEKWFLYFAEGVAIEALVDAQRYDEAHERINRALSLAELADAPWLHNQALGFRAYLLHERGDSSAALQDMTRAIDGLDALGIVVDAALLRARRAQIFEAQGKAKDAASDRDGARQALQQAGAHGLLWCVDTERR